MQNANFFFFPQAGKVHILKTQMSVNLKDRQIICLPFANGKKHDFRLFKVFHIHVLPETELEADTRDLGLNSLHTNSSVPQKRSMSHPLTKQGRKENREISR